MTKDIGPIHPRLLRKLRLVMLLALIGGPIVFGVGLYRFLGVRSLETKGVTVEGDVRSGSILGTGKGRHAYKLVVEYRPEAQSVIRKEFTVPKEEFEAAQSSRKIPVRFLPSKPSFSAAGKEVRADTEPMAIGAGVFVAALVILLYFRKKGKELKEAIFDGAREAPEAEASQPNPDRGQP